MSSFLPTTAVILAGGLGTRLRSVVADRPKVLATVGGRPFIEYLLDQVERVGLREAVLCTGFKGEQVSAHLGASYRSLRLRYSQEATPLGTGGALRLALPLLPAEPMLVLNGDSYYNTALRLFFDWHAARRAPASILLTEVSDTRRYGRVDVGDDGRITRFLEKAATEGAGWVNAGLYLLSRAVLESIPADRPVSLEKEIFPVWIGAGLHGFRSPGRLWDIGIPDAYAEANADFVRSLSR